MLDLKREYFLVPPDVNGEISLLGHTVTLIFRANF